MIKRNPHLARLASSYLFPEINRRKRQFQLQCPEAALISLGIGDTTHPLPACIANALAIAGGGMATQEGYVGYGAEQGMKELREKIAAELYSGLVDPDEIFISDGAKCDMGRLQILFGGKVSVAIQDPAYPVYVDGSLIQGVKKIAYLSCSPDNDFFPHLSTSPRTDLIYFCSPNNPTGAVATKEQLESLVAFARKNRSILLFDSAYSGYIQDPHLPKSIFEIQGAREVAIEMSSFSKLAGFTGVRLGWTIVPKDLKYREGGSVRQDWLRIHNTLFNGASHIAERGGLAALEQQGKQKMQEIIAYYLSNAHILKEALERSNIPIFGGKNAPYLWVQFKGKKSWDVFQHLLEKIHLVTTPGSGFGPAGEGFIRLSAFGKREDILQAASRLENISSFLEGRLSTG